MLLRTIKLTNLLYAFIIAAPLFAGAEDPRLEKDGVRSCVDAAKSVLASSEYYGEENEVALIGACSKADTLCVSEAGESLHPSDGLKLADFIKVIKACRGHGIGKCVIAMKGKMPSYDRREVAQILALIKKCD